MAWSNLGETQHSFGDGLGLWLSSGHLDLLLSGDGLRLGRFGLWFWSEGQKSKVT